MRFAVIVPYMPRISGNRNALILARELAKTDEVDLFTYEINKDIVDEVKELLGKSNLIYSRAGNYQKYGILFAIRYQLLKGIDRKIAKSILVRCENKKYDNIIVVSNEGHWIPLYLRKKHLRTSVVVMELHEHGILQFKGKRRNLLSTLFIAVYPLIRQLELQKFRSFDYIFSNSTWTSIILSYFYGINDLGMIAPVDESVFKPNESRKFSELPFIALPTVSIKKGSVDNQIARKLNEDGINLISFGPNKVEGIPYLGYLSGQDVAQILNEASATLFLFNYEALGLIPVESLMCGTPVVSYPKQGPYLEFKDNKNVKFSNDYNEIREFCRYFIENHSSKDVSGCRESVQKFFIQNALSKIRDETT